MTDPDQQITYVIPTYNRAKFLRRALQYYADVGCRSRIIVADSSESQVHHENRKTIATFRGQLNLQYFHCELGVIAKCRVAVEAVTTPLLVFSADDDFQVPSAIDECAEYLLQHEDFTTCCGDSLFVQSDNGEQVVRRSYRSSHSDNAIERLRQVSLGQYFCLFYAVHRTDHVLQRFRQTEEFTSYETSRILPEVLLLQLLALRGKIQQLDNVSYIRQGHGDNDSCRLPNVQDSDRFRHDYERYCQPLVAELQQYGISGSAASDLIRQSLLDLAPKSWPLLLPSESKLHRRVRRMIQTLRKLRSFGLRKSGRKSTVSTTQVASLDPAIAHAFVLLKEQATEAAAA